MRIIFASLVAAVAACSSSPLDPGAGNSGGSGTNTLLVTGSARAQPNTPNAGNAADFTTNFSVRVELNNAPVTTGTVTITASGAKTNLAFNTNGGGGGGNGGRWEGTANGYDEVYQLDVTSGADKVSGVRVDGPDIHTIAKPVAGASLDSTMANDFQWNRGVTATVATLSMDGGGGGNGLTIADTGSYSIAPNMLPADKAQTRTVTLSLVRENQVTPTGAVAGSQLAVSVENSVDIVVLANPNLP